MSCVICDRSKSQFTAKNDNRNLRENLNGCLIEIFEVKRALNGCSARVVPKCLEMPVIFKPSLDWLDGIG